METIVFKPKSKKDQELLMALGKKMNIPYEVKTVKNKPLKKKEVLLEEEEGIDVIEQYKNHPVGKKLIQGLKEVKEHIDGKRQNKEFKPL